MHLFYIVAFAALLYFFVHFLYSVEYVGGSALYGSPITQALFPNERSLLPTWGYDPIGMARGDPTKYGPGSFWPNFIPYKPSVSASGGLAPNGEMRDGGIEFPVQLREGYRSLPQIRDVYDQHADIPQKKVQSVGWWGN
jgi:hypothetical protein